MILVSGNTYQIWVESVSCSGVYNSNTDSFEVEVGIRKSKKILVDRKSTKYATLAKCEKCGKVVAKEDLVINIDNHVISMLCDDCNGTPGF